MGVILGLLGIVVIYIGNYKEDFNEEQINIVSGALIIIAVVVIIARILMGFVN